MDWTEVSIEVPAKDVDKAGDIAQMVVPYGIYIEDYRTLLKRKHGKLQTLTLLMRTCFRKTEQKVLFTFTFLLKKILLRRLRS